MSEPMLYKVLGPKGQSIHGGSGDWFLPEGKRPGKWMPKIDRPRCCERGYHLVELWSLTEWLRRDCTIYVAEGKGAQDGDGSGKTAFAQARLVRRVHISELDMRLFAADCAEHVLHIFKKERPNDDRPRGAIEAARAYARGEIGDAARDAARNAARDAARAAAGAAAGNAAGAAAGAAAWAAPGATAGAAARATAWAAARAAGGDAAWAAGGATAGAAAWDAAWDAERQWQATRLATYLKDTP